MSSTNPGPEPINQAPTGKPADNGCMGCLVAWVIVSGGLFFYLLPAAGFEVPLWLKLLDAGLCVLATLAGLLGKAGTKP